MERHDWGMQLLKRLEILGDLFSAPGQQTSSLCKAIKFFTPEERISGTPVLFVLRSNLCSQKCFGRRGKVEMVKTV